MPVPEWGREKHNGSLPRESVSAHTKVELSTTQNPNKIHSLAPEKTTSIKMRAKKALPLSLLYEADRNRIHGRTRLQKLVFLAQQQTKREEIHPYQYIEYNYGHFSKELVEALENYERKGLIEIEITQTYDGTDKYIYSLTFEGVENFSSNLNESPDLDKFETIRRVSSEIIRDFNKMPISELIDFA